MFDSSLKAKPTGAQELCRIVNQTIEDIGTDNLKQTATVLHFRLEKRFGIRFATPRFKRDYSPPLDKNRLVVVLDVVSDLITGNFEVYTKFPAMVEMFKLMRNDNFDQTQA